jgi:outer membrane protein OmpA-like peptidoglycan-associated protein
MACKRRLDFAALAGEADEMKKLFAPLALLALAACRSAPLPSHLPPPQPPPPEASPPAGQQHAVRPPRAKPSVPGYAGTAGPLTAANVGTYMDALERDLRHYLRGIPVARPGDVVVLNLKSDDMFDKARLNDDGRDLLRNLSSALRHYDHTLIQVGGYTDTSGTPESNLRISQKRADAVAAELRADGVAANRLTAAGFGATHLKKATGEGVSEARNRRIEIRILPHVSS